MTVSDDRILEFLAKSGAAHNKRGIELNIALLGESISTSTLDRRLPKLETAGLVETVDDAENYYRITDRGRTYLEGELDLDTIGTLDDDDRDRDAH